MCAKSETAKSYTRWRKPSVAGIHGRLARDGLHRGK